MVPIPGTSKVEHLEENVATAKVRFTPEEMRRID
jgi:aryl-alcohol dehydrogenase-like predicted oxidoreductase